MDGIRAHCPTCHGPLDELEDPEQVSTAVTRWRTRCAQCAEPLLVTLTVRTDPHPEAPL